jgi:hypothetical protein
MCIDPVSLAAMGTAIGSAASSVASVAGPLSTALSIGGSVLGYAQQSQAADAKNAYAMANAQSASMAAQRKYEDEQRKFIYDSKVNQKEAYDATLRGRSAVASGVASAGAAGFDASSISVAGLLAAERQKTAENLSRSSLKQEDLLFNYDARVDSYEAEAQGRINSVPMTTGPSPLALALSIGNDVVKYQQKKSA